MTSQPPGVSPLAFCLPLTVHLATLSAQMYNLWTTVVDTQCKPAGQEKIEKNVNKKESSILHNCCTLRGKRSNLPSSQPCDSKLTVANQTAFLIWINKHKENIHAALEHSQHIKRNACSYRGIPHVMLDGRSSDHRTALSTFQDKTNLGRMTGAP